MHSRPKSLPTGPGGYVATFSAEGVPLRMKFLENWYAYDNVVGDSETIYLSGVTSTDGLANFGFDLALAGGDDSFVAALSPNGEIAWSSYIGGINDEGNAKVAIDPSGNLVVAGTTESPNSPVWISGGHDTTFGGASDAFVARLLLGEPVPPPAPSFSINDVEVIESLTSLFIADIRFESSRGGNAWRVLVEVRSAVDNSPVEGVSLLVDFAGTTYTVVTDSDGIARTDWQQKLAPGDYYADAYDLALEGYLWDSLFSLTNEDDSDGDGKPDDLLQLV